MEKKPTLAAQVEISDSSLHSLLVFIILCLTFSFGFGFIVIGKKLTFKRATGWNSLDK